MTAEEKEAHWWVLTKLCWFWCLYLQTNMISQLILFLDLINLDYFREALEDVNDIARVTGNT